MCHCFHKKKQLSKKMDSPHNNENDQDEHSGDLITSSEIEVCITSIEKDCSESNLEEMASELFKKVEFLWKDSAYKKLGNQLQNSAVNLWNITVIRKTAGTITGQLHAKLRHIACNLAFLCDTALTTETILRRQSMMALKTARAWLDCRNPRLSEAILKLASESLDGLRRHQRVKYADVTIDGPCPTNTGRNANETVDVLQTIEKSIDSEMLKLICYKMETAVALNHTEKAHKMFDTAKELTMKYPHEVVNLSEMCYNFGVTLFNTSCYEDCTIWLREGYDLAKAHGLDRSPAQARALRLLACAYLEWDSKQHWQKALNAIGLANTEQSHPMGLMLKVRINLEGEMSDSVLQQSCDDVLKHPHLTADEGLSLIKLTRKHNRPSVGYTCLKQLMTVFKAADYNKIFLVHLDLLLQDNLPDDAKKILTEFINNTSDIKKMEPTVRKTLHVLIWERASSEFDNRNYTEALHWYDASVNLFLTEDVEEEMNLAKLHRNRTSCLLWLNLLEKADTAVMEAIRLEPLNTKSLFLRYKISMSLDRFEEAKDAIMKMCSDGDPVSLAHTNDLMCLAAQIAFEKNNQTLAVKTLERVIKMSSVKLQILIALRCLIRLRMSMLNTETNMSEHVSTIVSYFNEVLLISNSIKIDHSDTDQLELRNEMEWFMKVAWNLALQCEDNVPAMRNLFVICCQLCRFCPESVGGVRRQKICALMAAASCLQQARQTDEKNHKKSLFETVLKYASECQEISQKIDNEKSHDRETNKGSSSTLLLLYEFESRIQLGDSAVSDLLDAAISVETIEAKTFDTLAALALEVPTTVNRALAVKALKVSVRKNMKRPDETTDYKTLSRSIHHLIELSLDERSVTDVDGKIETWTHFKEIVSMIENKAKENYPEHEVLWLMIKTWNTGILFYSVSKFSEAEKWCGIGMRLLGQLRALKENYVTKMTDVYSEILSKMEASEPRMLVLPAAEE